jgi:thiamine biosynthesis lipoprotein
VVPLAARALATSAPLGTTFDEDAKVGHILDPRTGLPARAIWQEITVSANSAALADALSTAGCLFDTRAELDTCMAQFRNVRVEACSPVGTGSVMRRRGQGGYFDPNQRKHRETVPS